MAPTTAGAARGERAADLDLFKTMLVWGMITAHCIQLLAVTPHKPAAVAISDGVNLLTFSGFMFAFGWGLGLSRAAAGNWWRRLRPVLLLALATWLSEFAFILLVERARLTPELAWSVLSFSRLYGWSEFLASFAMLYLVIAVARKLLVRIGERPLGLVAASILCLASTLLVVSRDIPLLATMVGTTNFASFPLLPYLPWFLLGIFFARQPARPAPLDWLLAAIASGMFVLWTMQNGEYPGRFPPTALWVAGPALLILIYRAVARLAVRHFRIPGVLLAPGRHVLAALLLSNLIIFGLRYLVGFRLGLWWWTPVLGVAIISVVTFWAVALDRLQTRARTGGSVY